MMQFPFLNAIRIMLKFMTDEYFEEKNEYLLEEWFEYWARSLRVSRFPLSGDVTQWITAWGEVVGQAGWFNFNLAGSSNPRRERQIGEKYSYGRQLGRILDVLAPLVEVQRKPLEGKVRSDKLSDFEHMVDDIERMKNSGARTKSEIVRAVQCWKTRLPEDKFKVSYDQLMHELEQLKPVAAQGADSAEPTEHAAVAAVTSNAANAATTAKTASTGAVEAAAAKTTAAAQAH